MLIAELLSQRVVMRKGRRPLVTLWPNLRVLQLARPRCEPVIVTLHVL